jgi:hypothetical protein
VDELDRRPQVAGQGIGAVVVEAVDLDLGPRLDDRVGPGVFDDLEQLTVRGAPDVEHRVNQQMRRHPVPLERDPHGVDQEWGVVRHDQNDRTLRRPPVTVAVRRQHPDQGFARSADATDAQLRLGQRVEVFVATFREVELGKLLVTGRHEVREQAVVGTTGGSDPPEPLHPGLSFAGMVSRQPHFNRHLPAERTTDGRY